MKKISLLVILVATVTTVFFLKFYFKEDLRNLASPSSEIKVATTQNKEVKIDKRGIIIPSKASNLTTFVEDKTFWKYGYKKDRVYFGKDGSFLIQLFENNKEFKNGDVLNGYWNANDKDEICFKFENKKLENICYPAVFSQSKNEIPGYTDELTLIDPDSFINDLLVTYDSQDKGNLILNKEYAIKSKEILTSLKKIDQKIRTGSFNRKQAAIPPGNKLSSTYKEYFDKLFNNIHDAPFSYARFRENGNYSAIMKGDFEKYKNNSKILKQKMINGKWWLIDNKYHCYGNPEENGNWYAHCTYILPAKDLFIYKKEGFGVFNSLGFTLHFSPKQYINLNDFPNSKLFD